MTRRISLHVAVIALALSAFVSVALAGGWAVITLNDFPDSAVAGRPLDLTFSVRQHGQTLLTGLQPSVRAVAAAGNVVNGRVVATANRGEYTTSLALPEPGQWSITINSGFNDNAVTLPALKVFAAGLPAPEPFAPATQGVRLFTAKGCVGCHRHLEVNPERTTDTRFDLTGRRFPPDYLKKFLADPSIKTSDMPNMKLKDNEIEALAAFINKAVMKKSKEGDVHVR
jgi:mono/diheme cytochrome c family protein